MKDPKMEYLQENTVTFMFAEKASLTLFASKICFCKGASLFASIKHFKDIIVYTISLFS